MNDPQIQVKGRKIKKENNANMFEEWGEQMNEEWEDFTKDSKKAMKKIKDTLGDVVDDHKNIIVVSAVGVAAVIVGVILIVALLGYGISKLFDD